jgi:hypothetical protein
MLSCVRPLVDRWWWPGEAETCRQVYVIKRWIVHVLVKLLQSLSLSYLLQLTLFLIYICFVLYLAQWIILMSLVPWFFIYLLAYVTFVSYLLSNVICIVLYYLFLYDVCVYCSSRVVPYWHVSYLAVIWQTLDFSNFFFLHLIEDLGGVYLNVKCLRITYEILFASQR